MRTRSIAAVFVAVLLVGSLASCSKKDSNSSDESTDKTEETAKSTTTEDTSNEDSSSNDDSSSSGDLDATDILGDCGQAAILYSSMIASSGALMGGATDEQMQELEDQVAKLQDEVPADLQDDMQTVADAYKEFATAISENGIMSDEVQAASENMDSDEVKAATDNLSAYFDSCGS